MPLDVLAGPGCDAVGKLDYVLEHRTSPDDVVISTGSLFKSLTASDAIPSSNTAALRIAMSLRDEAIRLARARELNGYILTSNGSRKDLDRLAALGGGNVLDNEDLTEVEACSRIAALVGRGRWPRGLRRGHKETLVWAVREGRDRY